MKRRNTLLLCMFMLAVAIAPRAWGQLSNYVFMSGSGTAVDVGIGTAIFTGTPGGGYTYNGISSILPIGFTFNFSGTAYTTFSVNSNGLMRLGGSSVTSSGSNSLTGAPGYPVIAPYWDQLRVSGGVQGCGKPNVKYLTDGAAPNRRLTVEWRDLDMSAFSPRWVTFQARLYENGKIEFYYGRMSSCDVCNQGYGCTSGSATIGIAVSGADYMSITPFGGGASMSRVSPNDFFNLNGTSITNGELYSFIPCSVVLTGRTGAGNGGTATMANGDTFFNGFLTQVGSESTWLPFTQRMTDAACSGICTLTISGAASGDYFFGTPGTTFRTVNLAGGVLDTVGITFRPTVGGLRSAVLTVTGPGLTRTFNLGARAPLVNYTGILPQGGTSGMNTGDTLMANIVVQRRGSDCFTPFFLTDVSGAAQNIDYTLNDPSGQYSITPDVMISANGTTTPTICFSPINFGPQYATLTVNAGGEIRSFILAAISAAPGGDLRINNVAIDTTTQMFRHTFGCVGEEAVTIPVTMVNRGYNNFQIDAANFYLVDSVYGQGVPNYPYLRDNNGYLVPSYDYIVTEQPGVAPRAANTINFPIVVAQGQSRTIYITFIGQLAGKRFARAVFYTNGQSSSGIDTNGVLTEGVLSFNLFGRANSSKLSDRPGGTLPQGLVFSDVKLRSSEEKWYYLVNNGICPLRVSLDRMVLVSGDVDEFEIVQKPSSPSSNVDPVTNDLILAPGAVDSVLIRFTPIQIGSRRAGLRLATNDSTIQVPGITERGTYYADLYGSGKADLYGEGTDLGSALIGGDESEKTRGVVRFKNTRLNPVTIVSFTIEGLDSLDFGQDASKPWPVTPSTLDVGEDLELVVVFGPQAGGTPGPRIVTIRMITSSGDTVEARVRAIAGTRTISVTPNELNFGPIQSGKISRQSVTIKNTGTLMLKVTEVKGPTGTDFAVTNIERMELAPNQEELFEVTFAPTSAGQATATVDITSNATNGLQQVTLNGTATKAKGLFDDPSATTGRPIENADIALTADGLSVSGVDIVRAADGTTLFQSAPNPGRDIVEFSYSLPARSEVTLALYDAQGRLVRSIDAGLRQTGVTRVSANLAEVPAGVYFYRLTTGGHTLVRQMTIVR